MPSLLWTQNVGEHPKIKVAKNGNLPERKVKKKMKKTISLIAGSLFVVGFSVRSIFAGANSPWGDTSKIKVGVVIQSGDGISAWTESGRNDMTGNATSWIVTGKTEMEPVGDGTYQLRVDLIPGGLYNYIFGARLIEAMAGFPAGYEFPEPIPNGTQTDDSGNTATSDPGTFISLSSTTVNQPTTGSVSYISIGGDARRKLIMPDVDPGTTVYIFNNFGSIPRGVANYSVYVSSWKVELRWQGGLGTWGSGSAAVDCFGGRYYLYVSTSNAGGPYSLLATLSGQTSYYVHTNLSAGTSYYYIFVSSDAYNGITLSTYTANKSLWANLSRAIPPNTAWNSDQYAHNDKYGKPNVATPVYFKVENIDEDYVKQHDNIVYMTPWDEDGRFYPYKIPGTFISVFVPN